MIKKKVKVLNESGLHARPSSMLVKTASQFESDLFIEMYGYRVNGKSILGLMTLAAEKGSEMELIIEGPDEEKAAEVLTELFENKFKSEKA
ncbi:MAG: HPr family phosphocarrier protein [Bacteroidetes bacterium]|jgi:phosphocarrier protein|nr:HPr family phosphocarrier protein [Bacteroidota bacterium]